MIQSIINRLTVHILPRIPRIPAHCVPRIRHRRRPQFLTSLLDNWFGVDGVHEVDTRTASTRHHLSSRQNHPTRPSRCFDRSDFFPTKIPPISTAFEAEMSQRLFWKLLTDRERHRRCRPLPHPLQYRDQIPLACRLPPDQERNPHSWWRTSNYGSTRPIFAQPRRTSANGPRGRTARRRRARTIASNSNDWRLTQRFRLKQNRLKFKIKVIRQALIHSRSIKILRSI